MGAETDTELERRIGPALAAGVDGVLICGRVEAAGDAVLGAPAHAPALTAVRALRARWGPVLPVIAGGAGPEPADALLDPWHLAPGMLGLGLFLATLALLGPYLLRRRQGKHARSGNASRQPWRRSLSVSSRATLSLP